MEKVGSFRELLVWQQAMCLVEDVYRATAGFPATEQFGLTRQIQRAAVSIPSNIAEGTGRGTRRDYQSFLRIARGSLRELDTQIEIALRLGYLKEPPYFEIIRQISSIGKLLTLLIASLEPKAPP